MEQVIDDNNQGLYYYEAGQLENASSCFRNALYGISLLRDVSIQNSDFPQFAQHICSPIKGWSLPAKSAKKDTRPRILSSVQPHHAAARLQCTAGITISLQCCDTGYFV
mmetsp:Transcript_14300/g.21117  ORF Transcript_14300/g.21117 Transcript_14300/m.21117 type:complete len:109 (+) Transcript_14300:472-798(+)